MRKKEEKSTRSVFIHSDVKKFVFNGKKYVIENHKSVDNELLRKHGLLFFDVKKLQFPLTIREFKQGDKFQPIGLKGQKLLSDWFIDKKMSRFEKQSIGVIEDSKNVIIGLLGQTISEKVKINTNSNDIICIRLHRQN
ncbi:MAG: tRNA lysidine(34) synthetase TilS [Bacteroidetes bacterium]|nr:tRNA lysidine(34) synthetase TilS [Bacteroidota bacterium]